VSEQVFKWGIAVAASVSRIASYGCGRRRLVILFSEADATRQKRRGKERRRALAREKSGAMRARGKEAAARL
jgi:hypothetical protein